MENLKRNSLTTLLLLIISIAGHTQVTFDGTNYYFNNTNYDSFIPKVITDINGDYVDDVLVVEENRVTVYHNTQEIDSLYKVTGFNSTSARPWAQGVFDLDNDGRNELFFSGSYDGLFVYRDSGTNTFSLNQQISAGDFFAQAFSIADIDNDGFIDMFLCNDDEHSKVFINDGAGNLIDRSDYIDMNTDPVSDNSGNYSSVWTDIDGDMDVDLYIGKCRLGVLEDTDPRRINALFINNGDGTFTEAAAERGVASGAQTWAADFGDFNGDGFQDLVIANHGFPNQLYINDGLGNFTEDIEFRTIVVNNGTAYQTIVADFDNNGWEDIMVAGIGSYIYYNDGGQFTAQFNSDAVNGLGGLRSGAFGDINNDGFIDIYGGSRGLSGSDLKPDQIYINQGNDNHFLSVALQGTVSNRMGVGALVRVYTPEGVLHRFSKAGVSYSIQNTMNQHFGLGASTTIDSVTIDWPSGMRDVITEIEVDQHYLAIENSCFESLPSIYTEDEPFVCDGGSEDITIFSNDGIVNWSTGEVADKITVSEPGTYQAFKSGCDVPSNTLVVHSTPILVEPVLNVSSNIVLCEGSNVEVAVLNYEEIEWQDGSISSSYVVEESGTVQAQITSLCAEVFSEEISVEFVSPLIDMDRLSAVDPGPATLSTGVDNTTWFDDELGSNLIQSGDNLAFEASVDTAFYFSVAQNITPISTTAGFEIANSDLSDNFFDSNGLMYFSPQRDLVIKSVNVESTGDGVREIVLVKSDGTEIGRVSVDLPEGGVHEIALDWSVVGGENYRITTDSDVNQASFQTDHPQFKVLFNPGFPLQFDTWLTLTNSSFPSIYFFFFDWKLEAVTDPCITGEIYKYDVQIIPSSTEDVIDNVEQITVFPNPTAQFITVDVPVLLGKDAKLTILNHLGKVVSTTSFVQGNSIDVSALVDGQYYILVSAGGNEYRSTFTKSH